MILFQRRPDRARSTSGLRVCLARLAGGLAEKKSSCVACELGVVPSVRRLLETLLEHGRSMGCKEAWVGTEQDNEAARAFSGRTSENEDAAAWAAWTAVARVLMNLDEFITRE